MATVRSICTSALSRLRVLGAGDTMSAEDGELAASELNDMLYGWAADGVDVQHQTLALGDTFRFFVPPKALTGNTLSFLEYQGTWNASTNSPTLESATGTEGHLYRVSVAGTTALDDVSSWAEGDYLVFDGTDWLKGLSSTRFDGGVIDMLALSLSAAHGKEPSPVSVSSARNTWTALQAAFIVVDEATVDNAIRRLPSRRYFGIMQE